MVQYSRVLNSLISISRSQIMRRAFAALRQGRPGPVMEEIPADIALQEVDESE